MALSFDYATKTISVPQSDCTLVSGTFYFIDTNTLRLAIMAELASEDGIWADNAYNHNTEVTIAGTTYARTIEMINSWKLEFTPDSQWTVELRGSNNNMWSVGDGVLVQNQVQVIPTNSAGLISGGAGATAAEVWNYVGSSSVNKEDDLKKARQAAETGMALSA